MSIAMEEFTVDSRDYGTIRGDEILQQIYPEKTATFVANTRDHQDLWRELIVINDGGAHEYAVAVDEDMRDHHQITFYIYRFFEEALDMFYDCQCSDCMKIETPA